jgi:hypothetical protein
MDTVQCLHCLGIGKELDSMSLTTGEKKYRQCSVCHGSGKVSAERSHFSQYPDVSLRKAQELMQIHGKPVEIGIAESEITVIFKDNTRFILGGFTVGYKGTGPDFTKRFLDEAGFDISKDDIAAMKPPITLPPYEEMVIEAPSLKEAKQKAQESIPPDAKIIALDVLSNGQQTTTVTGRGATDEKAIEDAKERVSAGAVIEKQEIQDEFRTQYIGGMGDSEELALKDARSHLPAGVSVEEEKVIQSVTSGVEEVETYVEDIVKQNAVSAVKSRYPNLIDPDIQITKIECIQPARILGSFARLFHLGKDRPGIYRVTWKVPFKVSIRYRALSNKVAHLTIQPQPAVKIRFQSATRLE